MTQQIHREPLRAEALFETWRGLHPSDSQLQSIRIVEEQIQIERQDNRKSRKRYRIGNKRGLLKAARQARRYSK